MSLQDYWPYPTYRDGQEDTVQQLSEEWDDYDVFVCRLPTAWGKTALSVAVQNYALANGHSAAITVPNNLLRSENLKDWPHLKTIKALGDYWIDQYKMSEKEFRKKIYKYGPKGSEYNKDKQTVKRVGTPICVNYHSYIAHKLQRNVVIVDEAHMLLNVLQSMNARKIWYHQHKYPLNLRSLDDVKNWADTQKDSKAILQLREELESLTPATLVQVGTDMYRGVEKPCLKLIPLSVENSAPIFWPNKTNKVVLISATIGQEDIDRMGLGTRRVRFIDAASPIPAERRAIKCQFVGNMSYSTQDKHLDDLVEKIKELRESNEGNGFVHASYSLAQKIRTKLREPWAVYHGRDNKIAVYNAFSSTDPSERKVMIGSGMEAGISMDEDIARWQAIAKLPFPSLGEPAMRWVARNQGSYYSWLVSQKIMQSAGRVCRGPEDKGITYVLDSSWQRWYDNNNTNLPRWFTEAVV